MALRLRGLAFLNLLVSCTAGGGADVSGEPGEPEGPSELEGAGPRAEPDPFGVRYEGGETTDFGNGSTDVCSTQSVERVVDEAVAEELGFLVDEDRVALAAKHRAKLRYNAAACKKNPKLCDETTLEVSAEIANIFVVDHDPRSDAPECKPSMSIAYLAAVHLRAVDGTIEGTYYAVLHARGDGEERAYLGVSQPDLRNFEGTLPLRLELERQHFAYLDIDLRLGADGATAGRFAPWQVSYDKTEPYPEPLSVTIGPQAVWGEDTPFDQSAVALPAGVADDITLSAYPGSAEPMAARISLRADAVEPQVDVDIVVAIDGEVVHEETVEPGTYVELDWLPYGSQVSFSVENPRGAGMVRANVLQDDCFVTTTHCQEDDCTTEAVYTVGFHGCYN